MQKQFMTIIASQETTFLEIVEEKTFVIQF